MSSEEVTIKNLRVSHLDWRKLRRLIVAGTIFSVSISGAIVYIEGGVGAFFLRADGYVTRDNFSIASSFEGQVVEVLVRPGDHVERGQKIAIVQSVGFRRTLSELAAEKARLSSRIAELEARIGITAEVMPVAVDSAREITGYFEELKRAKEAGLALGRSVQQMAVVALDAIERSAKVRAEKKSLALELDANRTALSEVASAYELLSGAYRDGVLYAPISGDIGPEIASVGQVLAAEGRAVAKIYTGGRYVLAYLPESYRFDINEGEAVGLKVRNEILKGKIERLFPVAGALPSEFQASGQKQERGQLMRIAVEDASLLPVNQRVQVTGCILSGCESGFLRLVGDRASSIFGQTIGLVFRLANYARSFAPSDFAVAQARMPSLSSERDGTESSEAGLEGRSSRPSEASRSGVPELAGPPKATAAGVQAKVSMAQLEAEASRKSDAGRRDITGQSNLATPAPSDLPNLPTQLVTEMSPAASAFATTTAPRSASEAHDGASPAATGAEHWIDGDRGSVPAASLTETARAEQPNAASPSAPAIVAAAPRIAEIAPEDPRFKTMAADALVTRGDTFFAAGDLASARLFYEHAVAAGNAVAALRLGGTFDPGFLARAGIGRVQGDAAIALYWYRQARDLGNSNAEILLKKMEKFAK